MKNYSPALKAALEAAAPDGGSYLAGQHQFHVELMASRDVSKALDAALKAAAPDGGSYQLGEHVFWETQHRRDNTRWGRVVHAFETAKQKIGLTGPSELH